MLRVLCERFVAVSVLMTLSIASLQAHEGATGVVKERMEQFKSSKASMKAIKNGLKAEQFALITEEATAISHWASEMIEYFPEGSNPPPSEALSRIWEEFNQFERLANENRLAAESLLDAASMQDSDLATEQFSELARSCKACHDQFRE